MLVLIYKNNLDHLLIGDRVEATKFCLLVLSVSIFFYIFAKNKQNSSNENRQ